MSNTKSNNINSKSYIIIESELDYDPNKPVLALRTDPPTPIQIKKGINIITVESFPELKYGFISITNGHTSEIKKIDLSHFDGSEMESMANMFQSLETEIDFGNLNTSNVKNIKGIFDYSIINYHRESPVLLPKFNLESVVEWGDGVFGDIDDFGVLDLREWVKSSFFGYLEFAIFNITELILDGLKLQSKPSSSPFINLYGRDNEQMAILSLKGCDTNTIKWICEYLVELVFDGESDIKTDIMDYLILDEEVFVWYDWNNKEINVITDVKNKSFVKIICSLNADPQNNKIQLKDENKTIIELQAGVNILDTETYPGLKYGFQQLSEWTENSENGLDIIEVNFDNFDWYEVKNTFRMLLGMKNIKSSSLDKEYTDLLINKANVTLKWHPKESTFTTHFIKSDRKKCRYSKDGKILLEVNKDAKHIFVKYGTEGIYHEAFKDCADLKIVYLPETIKEIGEKAFYDCVNLKYINIPDSVTTIFDEAFLGCKNLINLRLGRKVETFGTHLFEFSGLKKLTLPYKACSGLLFGGKCNIKDLIITDMANDDDTLRTMLSCLPEYPNILIAEESDNAFPYTSNGCLLDYFEDLLFVTLIPAKCFVIPEKVEGLAEECLGYGNSKRINCLYIPDTVEYIDQNLFMDKEENQNIDAIIIKETYLDNFLKLLPYCLGDVQIYLI